jgi:MFS family permease
MNISKNSRSAAVAIFFVFMLLHQTDRLLIGPLTTPIMSEFQLSEVQMGGIITASLILGSLFYPIWGYLYDRFTRPKLLALASLIWGLTTWFSAIAPNARLFLISRASTGIDDSSYPGIGSLISDYYPPEKRSRIFGLLQLAIPLGYLLGLILALQFAPLFGWRVIYLMTGLLGLMLAALILAGVKDIPRGSSEPELDQLSSFGSGKFELRLIREFFQIPTLVFLFLQGFIGVLPWQVITFWSFRYLEVERGYSPALVSSVMIPAVLMIGLGYVLGGYIGDLAYTKDIRGRLFVAIAGIILGAIFLSISLNTPYGQVSNFRLLLSITCFFIPLASPNIATTVYDVVLPEVRSTATSIQYFLGNLGSAFAPLLAGLISQRYSLQTAMLSISLSAWSITAALLGVSLLFLKNDRRKMHQSLTQRAQELTKTV